MPHRNKHMPEHSPVEAPIPLRILVFVQRSLKSGLNSHLPQTQAGKGHGTIIPAGVKAPKPALANLHTQRLEKRKVIPGYLRVAGQRQIHQSVDMRFARTRSAQNPASNKSTTHEQDKAEPDAICKANSSSLTTSQYSARTIGGVCT